MEPHGPLQACTDIALVESFIVPTNAEHINIKTLQFFTLKYITIAPHVSVSITTIIRELVNCASLSY